MDARSLEEKQMKNVPVFDKAGKVICYVSRQSTSIGAAKAAGFKGAQLSCRFGQWGWIEATR
jgi:hypothetical protein